MDKEERIEIKKIQEISESPIIEHQEIFGIGIGTINAPERLLNLLESIVEFTKRPYRVYVLDDGSDEELINYNRTICKLMNVHLGEHRGQNGEPLNHGISITWNNCVNALDDCKYIALLNDDVVLTEDWDEALIGSLERNENIGMVSLPEKLFSHDTRIKTNEFPIQVLSSQGFCFAFSHKDWLGVGHFNEMYKSFYEEVQFGNDMISKLGKSNYILPYPVIKHNHEEGHAFSENPKLRPSLRMKLSKKIYELKYNEEQLDELFNNYTAQPIVFFNGKEWKTMEKSPEIFRRL